MVSGQKFFFFLLKNKDNRPKNIYILNMKTAPKPFPYYLPLKWTINQVLLPVALSYIYCIEYSCVDKKY